MTSPPDASTPPPAPRKRHRFRLRKPSLTTRAKRLLAWGTFSLAVLMLTGLVFADQMKPPATGAPSTWLPVEAGATALDRELQPLQDRHPGKTGVLFVADGLDAFAARALSARQAGRSLDLQYYIWHDDLTGRLLGREAWLAAERGVRVRILLDDINAIGKDAGLGALDRHPNIEVRLYNPFRNRAGFRRLLEMAQRLVSLNHRMHNKAWIADGRVAVVGGRNIGREYFAASTGSNFHDLDLVLFGPAVADASDIFDAYWNSDAAVPLQSLDEGDLAAIERLMESVTGESDSAGARVYLSRVDMSQSVREYAQGMLAPIWTDRVSVVSDPPLKQDDDVPGKRLVDLIEADLRGARDKALIISPYFVPGDAAESLQALARGGVHVGVVTNSLAANDVVAVHGGYAKYRPDLLRAGVRLYEIRPQQQGQPADGRDDGKTVGPGAGAGAGGRSSGSALAGSGSGSNAGSDGGARATAGSGKVAGSGASLHTKAYLVDDRRGFIGSFNMDPRSADLNTEMGVFFDDQAMAAALNAEYIHLSSPALSWWTYLGTDGELRWLDRAVDPPTVYRSEPEADAWRRAQAAVFRWLPIESQL